MPPESLEIDWDLSRRTDIAVRNSGSLSHVYFDVTPQQMELSEVALLYPTLLDILIRHEGIGLVAGRDGEKVVVVGKAGSLWLGPTGSRLEGNDPLAGLPDPAWAADQLARLARFPHAGDLILLGAWNDQRVISFEEQAASHGGLGGPQNSPFIVYAVPGAAVYCRDQECRRVVWTAGRRHRRLDDYSISSASRRPPRHTRAQPVGGSRPAHARPRAG